MFILIIIIMFISIHIHCSPDLQELVELLPAHEEILGLHVIKWPYTSLSTHVYIYIYTYTYIYIHLYI